MIQAAGAAAIVPTSLGLLLPVFPARQHNLVVGAWAGVTGFLPGLILGGIGAGLTQAPLFAAASTLPGHRATTGSAVLNMARQVGSAVGVAALVAALASEHPDRLSLFHRGWLLELVAAGGADGGLAVRRAHLAWRTSHADTTRRCPAAGIVATES
jgi:hypothetical protein